MMHKGPKGPHVVILRAIETRHGDTQRVKRATYGDARARRG